MGREDSMDKKQAAGLTILGGAGRAIGSFLAWGEILGITASGMDGGDGWVTLIAGVVLIAVGYMAYSGKGLALGGRGPERRHRHVDHARRLGARPGRPAHGPQALDRVRVVEGGGPVGTAPFTRNAHPRSVTGSRRGRGPSGREGG